MGDAGSLTLGFLLAVIAIQGVLKTAAAVALLFPMLVLLVPIFDTSFVLLHRIKYGRSPWSADANHLHHRFVRVGFGQRRAALALYAWCGLLAGGALAPAVPPLARARRRQRGSDDHPRAARGSRCSSRRSGSWSCSR